MKTPRELAHELLPSSSRYFTSLTVGNIRCFGDAQTLPLTDDLGRPARWTIVSGENGHGKTTLLQLLALASGADNRLMEMDVLRSRDEPPRGRLHLLRNDEPATAVAEMASDGRVVLLPVDVSRAAPIVRFDGGASPLVCGYGAGRRIGFGDVRLRQKLGKSIRCASLFVDLGLLDAEEWLLEEDYPSPEEGGAGATSRRLDQLKDMLVRLLPDVADVRVGEATRDSERGPTVDFKTPYGWVPLDRLSLGHQSLIAWMVDFASAMFDRYGKHADPLAQPAIVLIDEIDLHMHPRWQRDLLGHLTERFPRTQFIATALSPLVAQAASVKVVVLEREGDQVMIENGPGTHRRADRPSSDA